MKYSICLIYACLLTLNSYAGIYCPSNITIDCTDDIHNTYVTGVATTAGQYYGMTPKYDDWGDVGQCNTGTILRKWYVDLNWNDKLDPYEPFCTQYITVEYDSEPVEIVWPEDISLSCNDEVPDSYPWISHGPCDMVGWSVKDIDFTIGNGVCDKIIRRFTVINWCTYDYGTEGIWTHDQKIFFADEYPPELKTCEDVTLSTIDCKGVFTVSNSAVDTGYCHNENISWHVTIDLFSDGSIDYEYGTHIYGDYHLPYSKNCDTVTITLPENVGIGWHQVTWKISDNCGNPDYCSQMVTMKDTKPPTPICYNNLSTVLMAGSGMVELNANTIMKEAYDNCSWPEWIKYSFSPDPEDVTKVFTCDDFGIQSVKVYAIDHFGNYDYCKVTILFDDHNDFCPDMLDYAAEVMRYDGSGLNDVEVNFMDYNEDAVNTAMSDGDGYFEFKDTELSQYLSLHPYKMANTEDVTILDMLTLKNYILGKTSFNPLEMYLADLNKDEQVGIEDLLMMREKILFQQDEAFEFAHYNSSRERFEFQSTWSIEEMVAVETYYAFVLGDIAKPINKGEHQLISARSKQFSVIKQGNTYQLIANASCCIDGMKLDFSEFENINIVSSEFEDVNIAQNGQALFMSSECLDLAKDQLVMQWHADSNSGILDFTVANYSENSETDFSIEVRDSGDILNIASNNTQIEVKSSSDAPYSIQIVDLQGRVVNYQENLKGTTVFATDAFQTGLYMIKVYRQSDQESMIYKYFKM